jgi:hypothetical protein
MSTHLSRGLVTSIPERYVQFALFNLKKIYSDLGCQLPIEIWEVGNELSPESKQKISAITDKIIWRNVSEFTDNLAHWKGFQVKAFIVANSSFNEVLLFDADGIFHQNPENLFGDAGYQETGFYLFRDLKRWVFEFNWYDKLMHQLGLRKPFKGNKFRNYAFYQERQNWLRRCLNNQKPSNFPIEWDYIWKDGIPAEPVIETYVDSGVVAINRSKHPQTIKCLYDLNKNHPDTYKYVWGDKETFWISALMAKEPFTVNPQWAYEEASDNSEGWKTKKDLICQAWNGKLFFTQKGVV